MKAFSVRENYLLNQLKWGYNKFATAGSTVEITNTNTTTNDNESHSESESESETQVFNEKNDIKYHDYEDEEEEEDNEYDSLLKAKLLSENSYNTDLERNGNVDTTKQRRRRGRFNIKDNENLKNPKLTIILAIVLFITCLHLLHSAFFDLGLRQPCSMKEHGHGHGHGHAHPHGYPHAHPHGHPHDHGRHHGYPHAHGDDQMDHHAHPSPPPPPHHRRSLLRQLATDLRLNNVNLSTNEKDNTTAAEIFEISLPKLIYGEPLYKQELLNYTFANSWGHPAVVDYIAPPSNINFTQVILGLSTTVDGVQYDRLAHIYLDGASIWRTSTIEPSGMLSHSYSEKDVTAYSKLFKSDGTLMFQLDNIITPRLTGAFNISLTAFYYNEKPNSSLLPHINSTEIELTADTAAENELIKIQDLDDEFDVPGSVRDFFDSNRPADQIHPLVAQPAPNRPPLVYLPNIPFKTFVPQLNFNTTKVKLQLFTSGNADEEFWYTNVLDEYKNIFGKQGHPFPGHGSCRVINVYADNYRVASLNPFPVIYTGGLSPALWRPTVSTGAFDVRALEVELTPILPLFWDQKTQLSIEIANCIDDELEGKSEAVDLETRDTDAPKPSKSGIGSNWITTANVLTWEDERIGDSDGEMLSFDNSTKVSSFGLSPPFSGNYHQFINAEYTSKINSMLNYTLYNGTQVNVITEAYFDAFQNNIISVKEFGDSQKVSFVPTSKHSFAIIDPKSEKVISQLNYTHAFPLRIYLNSKVNGPEVQYNVNITRNFKIDIDFNDVTAVQLKNKENGSSVFNLTPNGNYGFGSLEHNLTVVQSDPLPNTSYNRHSLAENGTLIYDTVELSI
ncbi:unnamed protein product [[Candida] boidinii]|uniref:Unnamed protein product n=1 Tax=Candida boidinii TaxID=5477 RepID=A0ACB5TMK3_CANBO|nr:unnamed protein product [[Candida] boidinii]